MIRRSTLALCIALAASQLTAHGDLHKRIAMLTQKIRRAPAAAELYSARAELHRLHKDWPAARRDFARARRLQPDLVDLAFREGRMELQARRPVVAVRHLTAELSRRPHVLAHVMRARALVTLSRFDAALRDYDAAVHTSVRPSADHYLERARLQLRMKLIPRRVVAGLNEAIKRLGSLVSLEIFALDLEVEARDWVAALARVDRILPTLPLRSPWLLRRGRIHRSMRSVDAARTDFAAAIRELRELRRRNGMQRALLIELKRDLRELEATR